MNNKILYILLLSITIFNILPTGVFSFSALEINNNNKQRIQIHQTTGATTRWNLGGDTTCLECVDFFDGYLQDIIKIITEYGVVESCSKICNMLLNNTAATTCTVLCDIIGVEKFWKIFLLDDINPIYACQLISTCGTTNYPAANFDNVSILPAVGVPGSTFTFSLNFTVINATGAGQFAYVVFYEVNESKYVYTQTFANYNPGKYVIDFTFSTSDNGSFPFGSYPVELYMCASECGTHTPYSIQLNESTVGFKLQAPSTIKDKKIILASFKPAQVTLPNPFSLQPHTTIYSNKNKNKRLQV